MLHCGTLNIPYKISEVEMGCEVTSQRVQMDTLHCTTTDHNLLTISKHNLKVMGCTVGNNDEVLDLVLMGECNTQLAVACNSPAIRLQQGHLELCAGHWTHSHHALLDHLPWGHHQHGQRGKGQGGEGLESGAGHVGVPGGGVRSQRPW